MNAVGCVRHLNVVCWVVFSNDVLHSSDRCALERYFSKMTKAGTMSISNYLTLYLQAQLDIVNRSPVFCRESVLTKNGM